jgi:hypothetical protein
LFEKRAPTDFAASIVTVQLVLVLLATQAPLQPTNVALFGVAVSVTTVPAAYASKQSVPQLIPAGELVTVPGPLFETVRLNVGLVIVNVSALETLLPFATMTCAVPAASGVGAACPSNSVAARSNNWLFQCVIWFGCTSKCSA